MQLTKQQKVYGAVLSLALACFCVDRWVIVAGNDVAAPAARKAPTPARRLPARQSPSSAAANDGLAVKASAPSVAQLAGRLQDAARAQGRPLDLENVKDAFRPSAVFVPVRSAVVVVQPQAPTRDEVAEFIAAHKLQAVMKRTNGGVAIVGTKTIRVGQTFEGFRLVAVKDRSAVFRRGRLKAELKLPEEAVAGEIIPTGTSEKVAGTEFVEE